MPENAVAFIFTHPLPPDMREALAKGKQGIMLVNGDHIEGSVRGLSAGNVTIDSVLFGRKIEQFSKVMLLALRPTENNRRYSIATRDGSLHGRTGVTIT